MININNPLEDIKVKAALRSEQMKLEYRKEHNPSAINILDYTVIAALEKHLNGGWIPVSQRMPDEGERVLVISNNDRPIYCVAIMMNGELRTTWNHDRFDHIKIVAWQPLPEPYESE